MTILHTEHNFHKHPAAGENGKKRGPSWVTVRFSGISGLHPKCQEGLQVRESCVSWCQVSGTSAGLLSDSFAVMEIPRHHHNSLERLIPDSSVCVGQCQQLGWSLGAYEVGESS